VILLAALVVLGAVNGSIVGKERVIRRGEPIFLELAPVDPRSLMQGDYMALRFRLAGEIQNTRFDPRSQAGTEQDDGNRKLPLSVDERRVATLDLTGSSPLQIRFRLRGSEVWLGTNAYFFTEGTAQRYARAVYGEFRLDRATGEAILVGLRDESLNAL
jgi:uncharacterized membrane-anchored protein